MKYVLIRMISIILGILTGYVVKTVNIGPTLQILFSASIVIILYSIILLTIYHFDDKEFAIHNKKLKEFSDNPFKNIFTWPIFNVSLSGTISWTIAINVIRIIPYSLYAVLIPFYVVPALFIEYYMTGAPITTTKIVSVVICLLGIIIAAYKNIHKDFKKFKSVGIGLLLILVNGIMMAYQTSYYKYLLNNDFNYVELTSIEYILSGMMALVGGLCYLFIYCPMYKIKPSFQYDMKGLFLLFITSIFAVLIGITKTEALDNLPEYLTILIGNLKIPITFLISYLFLKEDISYYKILGAILIIIGVSYNDLHTLLINNRLLN